MSCFTKELVSELASKLLIGLSEEENKMVLDEFEEIERNMDKINAIADIASVEAMTHPFPLEDIVLRNDDDVEELAQEDVLKNASHKNLTTKIDPKVVKE